MFLALSGNVRLEVRDNFVRVTFCPVRIAALLVRSAVITTIADFKTAV